MLTRADFLAIGLAPVAISSLSTDDICSICTRDFSSPVKLPCGHIFDSECIQTWLKMPSRNNCPMCKRRFFDLPEDEDLGVGDDRQAQIAAALRTSGVSEFNAIRRIDAYGFNRDNITRASLQRSTAHAVHYLGQETRLASGVLVQEIGTSAVPLRIEGPGSIRLELLSPAFLAMGSLIPALARAQGRAYTQQQSIDWHLTLTNLIVILRRRDGKHEDVATLPGRLRREVRANMVKYYSDVDEVEFFFVYADPNTRNPLSEDLDLMLTYLTFVCWNFQKDEEAHAARIAEIEAARRKGRKETKKTTSCSVM